MARAYAGILGMGGFVASVVRGAVHGVTPWPLLLHATLALLAGVAAGLVIGTIAAATIRHAVLDRLKSELLQRQDGATTPA